MDAYIHFPDNLSVNILKPGMLTPCVFNIYYYQICQQHYMVLPLHSAKILDSNNNNNINNSNNVIQCICTLT
jgi:hypothetical protein